MRTAFFEKEREDSIAHDGCVVVDFLDSGELLKVRQGIGKLGFGVENETKLRISITQDGVEKRNEIFEELSPVLQSAADKFLQNYKLIRIAIFDKLPGGDGVRIHQHANLVDESKYRSLATWLPLTETTVEMGTLYVVKGSHEFSNHVRSYDDYYRAFNGVSRSLIKRYSTPFLLKRGQAIIFDDRLIHWSPPNKSSEIRTAIQLELVPEEAELAIYYRTNEHELLKYAIDRKTYRETALTLERPENLELIGTLSQPLVSYGNKQFISMMRGIRPGSTKLKEHFFRRLFNGIRRRLGR